MRTPIRTLLRARFPAAGQIAPVYAIVAFVVFNWSIVVFFWKLPYYLLFLRPGEIGAVFSYLMVFALFETLLVVGLLLLVAFILPPGWFVRDFGYKGLLAALILLAGGAVLQYTRVNEIQSITRSQVVPAGVALLAALILLLRKSPDWQGRLVALARPVSIMIYLYVPLAVLCLGNLILRNLF